MPDSPRRRKRPRGRRSASSLRLSLGVDDLKARMGERLHGATETDSGRIVWEQRDARLLIHTASLEVRALEGWLLCSLDVQSDETGRTTLQFVFFLGAESDAGPHAASTINAATLEAAQIADRWGPDLQRVLWEAVLDGVEAAIEAASIQLSGRSLVLAGFFSTRAALVVDVVAGDR